MLQTFYITNTPTNKHTQTDKTDKKQTKTNMNTRWIQLLSNTLLFHRFYVLL